MKLLITLLISSQLVGCGFFVKKPTEDKNPLIALECPAELPTLTDATLGEHTKKSLLWLNQYHNCRRAALTGTGK